MTHPKRPLLWLNEDVLLHIIDEVDRDTTLPELSRTCRYLRSICLPILFAEHKVKMFDTSSRILPWVFPYVQKLTLQDWCPDKGCGLDFETEPLTFTDDRRICGIFSTQSLKDALLQMPRLTSLTLAVGLGVDHGLPWEALQNFLSIPHLRHIALVGFTVCPCGTYGPILSQLLSSLSAFHYYLIDRRPPPFQHPSETAALSIVLGAMNMTMESLILPSEPAPLRTISQTDWPVLRELRLRGRISDTSIPLILVLARMPKLRIVDLRLAPLEGHHITIWPSEVDMPCPWLELEEMVISHPTAADNIFDNLPPSLRRLSLRHWPHYYLSTLVYSPVLQHDHYCLLSPSVALGILQRMDLPHLEHLEIEYREDHRELELLHHIASTFPRLNFLQIHRYRATSDGFVPTESIARALQPLTHLQVIKLHLDFPDRPEPFDLGYAFQFDLTEVSQFYASTLQPAAETFARVLGRSLRFVWVLVPSGSTRVFWSALRVVRDEDANVVRCVRDFNALDPRHPEASEKIRRSFSFYV